MSKKVPPVDLNAADRFIGGESATVREATEVPSPKRDALPIAPLERSRDKRRVTVYLDPEVADATEALARKTRRPVTGVVDIALLRLLGMPE